MAPQMQEDGAFQRMRLAICSGNRRHVLLALYQRKKSLGTLREELDADAATIVHSLRELEHYRMVEEDELRDYSLTIFGKLLAEKVIDCHRLADVLTSFEAFWFEHDISGIPEYLLSRIGSLQDSNLITDTREHVLSGIETFIALIEGTDVVYLITPFYSLDFVTRLDVFASKDIEWHLIVTEEVIRRALMDAENRNVKAILRGEGEIRVIRQDPKLFFVSTGDEIALALAYVTGQLDYSTLLVSRGSDAITWGTGLFSYYNNRSEPVVLQ